MGNRGEAVPAARSEKVVVGEGLGWRRWVGLDGRRGGGRCWGVFSVGTAVRYQAGSSGPKRAGAAVVEGGAVSVCLCCVVLVVTAAAAMKRENAENTAAVLPSFPCN